MRALASLLLLATLLAGCSGDGGGPAAGGDASGDPSGGAAAGDGTSIPAPTSWAVGSWWTLDSQQATAPSTHVVSGDAGTDWTMDTDSRETAFFDERFDISFFGAVRKADLAGSQGTTRVEFFRFPLEANKTWTTTWDEQQVTIKVLAVADGQAQLESRLANGTLHATYTYDAAAAYFAQYAFYDADGAVSFASTLTDSGTGFGGELVRWTLETEYETTGPVTPGVVGFDVDASVTDIWYDFHLACTAGAVSINIGALAGIQQERGYSVNGPCPATEDQTFTLDPPAQDDEAWGASIASVPQGTQGTLQVTILSRTATTFKAGAAPA